MKIKSILEITTIGIVLTFTAQADLFDNFDSYTTKAQFDAVWTPSTGTGLDLYTAQSVSSPNSVKNPGTTAQASRRLMAGVAAPLMDFSYDFYDFDANNSARDYIQIQSRAGTDYTGTLQQLLAIGKYSNITGSKYFGRVAFETGGVYGDGATAPAATWFQLGGAGDRSVGLHTAQILGLDDPANPGMVRFEFYIDGILGGSVANINDSSISFNWLVLGSGLTTVPNGIAMDNVSIVTVPEPSFLALCLLGGFGLAAGVISRRRKV